MTTDRPTKVHQGRNVKRFREMLGLKQEALAAELGDDWNQKRVSMLESKEEIEADLLVQVARVLKVPEEAIKNLTEEGAVHIIANTFTNHDNSATIQGSIIHYSPTFNPMDKLMELFEENKKLYNEKVELLERLLQAEKEKIELLKSK
jgi:transcriptional regulator with XRE-family HTH domain